MIVQLIASSISSNAKAKSKILAAHRMRFERVRPSSLSVKDAVVTAAFDDIFVILVETHTFLQQIEALLRKSKLPAKRTLVVIRNSLMNYKVKNFLDSQGIQFVVENYVSPHVDISWFDRLQAMQNDSAPVFSAEDVDDQDNEVKVTANRPPLHFKHVLIGQGFVYKVKPTGEQKLCVKIKKTKAVVLSTFAEVHHDIPVFDIEVLDPDLQVEAFTGEQCYKVASSFKF